MGHSEFKQAHLTSSDGNCTPLGWLQNQTWNFQVIYTTIRKGFRTWTQINRSQKVCRKCPWSRHQSLKYTSSKLCLLQLQNIVLKEDNYGPWADGSHPVTRMSWMSSLRMRGGDLSTDFNELTWDRLDTNVDKIHCKKSFYQKQSSCCKE